MLYAGKSSRGLGICYKKIGEIEGHMNYLFISSCFKEGNRTFIRIPFNIWETCGKKGLIPVDVTIEGISFECKLVPKGNGEYLIPVGKDVISKLSLRDEYSVQFTILDKLTRIDNNSPYTKENPIRHIDSIHFVRQPMNGSCGQTCVAMLAGISVDDVLKIMKSTKWQASISKVLETLDYLGITYHKAVYTRGQEFNFPKCCILNVRGDERSHLLVYFDGVFYDPVYGIKHNYQYQDIICYIEIGTE
jgi:hypothetical protein